MLVTVPREDESTPSGTLNNSKHSRVTSGQRVSDAMKLVRADDKRFLLKLCLGQRGEGGGVKSNCSMFKGDICMVVRCGVHPRVALGRLVEGRGSSAGEGEGLFESCERGERARERRAAR